jgi:hypothetical protein
MAQGAYVAGRCPVRAQWDVLRPCEPLPASPVAQRRVEHGRSFESEVLAELVTLHPGAVAIDLEQRAERELATVAALREGAGVILGGRLPTDHTGRRTGEPDVLVLDQGSQSYRAVDVKAHQTHDYALAGVEATWSALEAPGLEAAEARPGRWARKRRAERCRYRWHHSKRGGERMARAGLMEGDLHPGARHLRFPYGPK